MGLIRKILPQEEKLLELLIDKSAINFPPNWKESLYVQSMQDDGMGSLKLFPNGLIKEKVRFAKQVSEYQFLDDDGVDVIVSLNIDNKGDLFELDIWKTDFSALKRIY